MSSQPPSRGGGATSTNGGGSSGTMTWASSRRLVITNDVPQIVVANSSTRCHDRGGTVFTSYSSRGTSSPNARGGGFQAGRGGCSTGYQIRNSSAPRGGTFRF
ncbi:unnamed protein product [Cylicostephanus goldi]|uniref:Uncharacterized protein n=1 Tax=Cylicostephanus goldi TaxID=71465 RepID=A0A3P7MFT5_CYLGO|nr:unnamed protein product [Cylicostephanus goldi]